VRALQGRESSARFAGILACSPCATPTALRASPDLPHAVQHDANETIASGLPASHLPLLGLREAAPHLRHQIPLLFLQVLEQQRPVLLEAVLIHGREGVRS